jgi:hypothetical protein
MASWFDGAEHQHEHIALPPRIPPEEAATARLARLSEKLRHLAVAIDANRREYEELKAAYRECWIDRDRVRSEIGEQSEVGR